MNEEERVTYLDILRKALVIIQVQGRNGRADRCAIEAYHVHNIPDLLKTGHRDKRDYYLDVERPSYLEKVGDEGQTSYGELWAHLDNIRTGDAKSDKKHHCVQDEGPTPHPPKTK